ncbi:MAG: HEPN domain-containing protein [Candidatus Caldatribacteriaceae bacterium]
MKENPWFDYASEDIKAAEILYNQGIYRLASFHAQQAVEKALKGLLWRLHINPPRVHDLAILYHKVREHYPNVCLSLDDLEFLSGIYLESRYHADFGLLPKGEPAESDTRRLLEIVQGILHTIWETLQSQ